MGVEGMNQVSSIEDEDFLEQLITMGTIPPCNWEPNPNPNPNPNPFDEAYNTNGFVSGSFHGHDHPLNQHQQQFHPPPPPQNLGGVHGASAPPASASTGGNSGVTPRKQSRVRARRGQATDPHSIAERLRRERIADRMKALQELVPNGNKTDKASMLDEIIDYVKFLQLQVKVVSMSRLGGAPGIGPFVAGMSSEGGGVRRSNNGTPVTLSENNNMTASSATENQVAKLMEEDMGSAMQYLQGKGLCLMPISLASAISTATCNTRPPSRAHIRDNDYNIVNNTPAVADNSISDASKK